MGNLGSTRSVRRRSSSSSLIRSLPPHMDRLNEELVIEVLQRLPLKDANRCKCVCKRWLNWISSPYFARCYINRHCFSFPPPFALFFQYTNTYRWKVPVNLKGIQSANKAYNHPVLNSSGFSLSFLPPSSSSQPSEPVRFLASSNGLVLCSPTIINQKLYYVCNPLTMHWVALPPPPTFHKRVRIGFISTPDFDNGIISRFKVVRIPEFEKISRLYTDLSLEIFSSETGEWTDFVISWHEPVFGCFFLCDSAVVCNGMLHWRYVYLDEIFAYNPNKTANYQEFRTIPLPKECLNGAYVHLFGESQGHLRYAEFDKGTFRVWELKEYSSSEWGLVHKFPQSELVGHPNLAKLKTRKSHCSITMLAFHPTEGDVMFLDWHGRIFECNMRSRSLKWLCSLAERTACIHRTIFPFVLPWWPISLPQC